MSDIREEARAEEPLRMSAYYYSFEPTGVIEIDRILSAVARAGKMHHHTERWDDDAYGEGSPVEWIQNAANEAGAVWADARKVEVTKEELARAMVSAINSEPGQETGWLYSPEGVMRVVGICAGVAFKMFHPEGAGAIND